MSELDDLLEKAREKVAAMTPAERDAMLRVQRESWVRGEMGMNETAISPPPAGAADAEAAVNHDTAHLYAEYLSRFRSTEKKQWYVVPDRLGNLARAHLALIASERLHSVDLFHAQRALKAAEAERDALRTVLAFIPAVAEEIRRSTIADKVGPEHAWLWKPSSSKRDAPGINAKHIYDIDKALAAPAQPAEAEVCPDCNGTGMTRWLGRDNSEEVGQCENPFHK